MGAESHFNINKVINKRLMCCLEICQGATFGLGFLMQSTEGYYAVTAVAFEVALNEN